MLDSHVTTAPVPAEPGRSARAARRWFLVAAPVLAGLLAVLGAAADPAVGLEGRDLYRLYADNPEAVQVKSLSYHFAYAFWGVAALLLAWSVRGRGAWLANLAAVLAFLGATSLPGFLLCLPVAALAAWRGGLVPWWAPVAVVAGIGGGFFLVGANVPGTLVMTAGFAALSVALARSELAGTPRPGRDPVPS